MRKSLEIIRQFSKICRQDFNELCKLAKSEHNDLKQFLKAFGILK